MRRRLIVACATAIAGAGLAQTAPQGKSSDEIPRAHGVPGDPPPAEAALRVLTCEGLFGPKATHAKLTEAFGPGNVTFDKQDGAEGETYMATTLFKKKPADRLIVNWTDEKRRQKPESLTAKADAPTPGSSWRLPNGLHPGSSLTEVEAANGKPFSISGFEWDYGGYATDWKGGKLAEPQGGCSVSIRFNPGPDGKIGKVSGDATFQSNDPKVKATKAFVSTITVSPK